MRSTTFNNEKSFEAGIQFFESYASPHPPQTEEPREYFIGDIYERYDGLKNGSWPDVNVDDGPYVRKIKFLAKNGWPQLRYLADFLDCSTVPVKQKALVSEDRRERLTRLHMVVLDITPGSDINVNEFDSADELIHFLDSHPWNDSIGNVRLFVVEDLSRTSIELLGSRFNLDPGFFRSHMCDYTWYNLRDPWFEMPTLPSRAKKNPYFTLRHVRPQYFRDADSAQRAKRWVGRFNVLRRIDFDKSKSWADNPGSCVGTVRACTSCYIRPHQEADQGWLGFLLVDPPVNEGYPLWSGYDNIRPPPAYLDGEYLAPHIFRSPLEDFVYWARTATINELQLIRTDGDFIISPIFSIIPAQWLLNFEHISNRLSLIEWEIEREEHRSVRGLDAALQRLHPWRRHVTNYGYRVQSSIDILARFNNPASRNVKHWQDLLENFSTLEKRFNILQAKIDKIMSVLTAVISIEETKKQMSNARDVSRITYLAFIYVPLSFFASFLSMNTDFPSGGGTVYWVFFVVSVPMTALSLLLAIYWASVQKLFTPAKKISNQDDEDHIANRKKR